MPAVAHRIRDPRHVDLHEQIQIGPALAGGGANPIGAATEIVLAVDDGATVGIEHLGEREDRLFRPVGRDDLRVRVDLDAEASPVPACGGYRRTCDMIREKIGSLLLRGFEALTPSAIRESEIRHRQLFEDNPFPMWLYDRLTLQFLAVNNAAIQHYGYSRDEFLSMTLADIRPTEDHAALFRYVAKQHSPRFPTSVWRHLRKDGSLIDVEITAYAMVFAGRPAEIVLAHDVTERMRVQADSAIISEIIQGAAITNDLVETIKLIHGCIGRSLYAENFYVALYDRRTEMLSIPFCVDKYDDIAPPMKLGRGLTAYVLRTEKPVILHGDDIDRLVETGEVNAVGTRSAAWLGVPLRTADEVTGAIVVQHY